MASSELRAYAANTVGSIDIIDESIQSVDIKNGQVKAVDIGTDAVGSSEIAPNSVGGSELIGVTKMLFGQCSATSEEGSRMIASGNLLLIDCTISGVDNDDSAIAEINNGQVCFQIVTALPASGKVQIHLQNDCTFTASFHDGKIGIIVFDR